MTLLLDRVVLGLPAPQGSKRAIAAKGGHVRVIESSSKVKPWREAIVSQLRDVWRDAPVDGPVYVSCEFYMPRPRSHYRTSGELKENAPAFCSTRPDGDKLLRSTLDALKTAGIYRDDSQVVVAYVEKRYVYHDYPTPCARLAIESLATTNRVLGAA